MFIYKYIIIIISSCFFALFGSYTFAHPHITIAHPYVTFSHSYIMSPAFSNQVNYATIPNITQQAGESPTLLLLQNQYQNGQLQTNLNHLQYHKLLKEKAEADKLKQQYLEKQNNKAMQKLSNECNNMDMNNASFSQRSTCQSLQNHLQFNTQLPSNILPNQ